MGRGAEVAAVVCNGLVQMARREMRGKGIRQAQRRREVGAIQAGAQYPQRNVVAARRAAHVLELGRLVTADVAANLDTSSDTGDRSSERTVSTSTTGSVARLSARYSITASVSTSAHWRSSRTSIVPSSRSTSTHEVLPP